MVIRFAPTSSGIAGVVQFVVPVAVPEPPLEFVQVTCVTPTLSEAVPVKTIVCDEVALFVVAGDRMIKVGGVVSLVGWLGCAGCVGVAGGCGCGGGAGA